MPGRRRQDGRHYNYYRHCAVPGCVNRWTESGQDQELHFFRVPVNPER